MVAEWAEEAALTNSRSNGVRSSRSSGNNCISITGRRSSTGSSNIVDLGAAVVAAAQRAIATTWPTSTLHCKHTYPALSVAVLLAVCLLLLVASVLALACLSLSACFHLRWLCYRYLLLLLPWPWLATIIIDIAAVFAGTYRPQATSHLGGGTALPAPPGARGGSVAPQ